MPVESTDAEFPKVIEKVSIPPIKCQGIKSKLVKFILANVRWSGRGTWFEPFLGSGVVAFNAAPSQACLSDINPHVVEFYERIRQETITPQRAREFLEVHGKKLAETGDSTDSYYYEMRSRFNKSHDPFYMLFLNRACYNGLIRFNSKGEFNSPFGRKPGRFSRAYITKIVNQIAWVQKVIHAKKYSFKCCNWKEALQDAGSDDFVYLDPPYYGRHATYFDNWQEQDTSDLAAWARSASCGYALSMWFKNKYRENPLIPQHWNNHVIRLAHHYYFLGASEASRTNMVEALIIKPGYETADEAKITEPYKEYQG